ncbi:DUF1631 family protein [Sedimenticola thiotaurini]|uniref:DUF1631 domain-containing protein n=1 Tax=Sedimenticola thiotaurini TaxID=1543721 RepID=A0A0F7JXS9_9GAMM|nr:DUF1631 family protein [Sedimenticola thiotaurini]AKH19580.1 hypothetical protein AAY24_03535 [Sedimenticola thiotaurini]
MSDTQVGVLPKFHPLIKDYQAEVDTFLHKGLVRLFQEVEPVMIDFASKAETDNAQLLFFDAITQVQNLSEQVTDSFLTTLHKGFSAFSNCRPIEYPRPIIEAEDTSKIEIVENQDLEIHIAIQSMITRSKDKNHQALYQLGQRLAVIQQGKKLRDQDIPASPEHVSTTFQTASDLFGLEQKLLLILYVLFEKCVLKEIGTLYACINKMLSDAGIYPHLPPTITRYKDSSRSDGNGSAQDGESAQQQASQASSSSDLRTEPLTNEDFLVGKEVFNTILSMLTERRHADPRFRNHPEYAPDGNLEQLRSSPELVTAINQLHTPVEFDMGVYADTAADDLSPNDRSAAAIDYLQKRITSERENLFSELDENTIPTADLDTIELVGMLFEHVLDDPDLASLTKTVICHLHTPYLKVAIIDREFLTNPDHIARKLLNLVVNAGRRWVDENNVDAGIYHTMRDMIHSIMRDFKDDISLFDRCYSEFLDHLRALEHRTRLLEERTREATRGKDRLEYARLRADEIMHQHCDGVRFHPVLWQFLSVVWKNYMTLLLLRDQEIERRKEWRSVLMVINSVIKINNGYGDALTAQWLKHAWPRLRKNIESGLDFLGNTNPSEYVAFKKTIAELQQARQSEPSEKVVVRPVTETKKRKAKSAEAARSATLRKFLEQAQQTEIGTWFEFSEPDGSLRRVKLSWYSPVTNNHMFLDRFGSKAFVIPTDVLVQRLANGTAYTVEPNRFPFVDQALQKIYRLLRKE